MDVSSLDSTFVIEGTVEDYENPATAHVSVRYPAVGKYDFGISDGAVAEGWTGITVNPKGGTKTLEAMGSAYTQEKGYGFENASSTMQGRSEGFTYEGMLPSLVYTDFAIPASETFLVDVENGSYQVEVISNSVYKSSVTGNAEGVAFSVGNAAGTYSTTSVVAEVTDGQLTIAFGSNTPRVGGVIVRKVITDSSYYGEEEEEVVAPAGQFITKWGATYYKLEDGSYLKGLWKIDSETYFFKTSNGAMTKSDFVTIDGSKYYFNANGYMSTGFMTKWGTTYYMFSDGKMASDTLFDAEDGYTYYAAANGAIKKSTFVEIGDSTYYFNADGHMVKGTTITKWFKKYTFDENGVLIG